MSDSDTRAERRLRGLRTHVERAAPNRARAVLMYIDVGTGGSSAVNRAKRRAARKRERLTDMHVGGDGEMLPVPKGLRGKVKPVKRGRGHRHPAKPTRADKRNRFYQPDATEQATQQMFRRAREAIRAAESGDGLSVGLLTVVAEHLAPQVCAAHGLDDDSDAAGVAQFLIGMWGEMAHGFRADHYRAWRQASLDRASRDAA